VVYSWHIHYSSSLVEQQGAASDQVQGLRYSEYEAEKDTASLKLEMDSTASGQVVSQDISNQERYATD
jgi:hypothetical protein